MRETLRKVPVVYEDVVSQFAISYSLLLSVILLWTAGGIEK